MTKECPQCDHVDIWLLISVMETFLQLSRKPGPDVNCVMCHQPLTITQCTHTQSGSPMSQRCPIPGCLIQHRWYRPVMWPCVTMCLSLCRVIASSLAPFKHLTPLTGAAVSSAITGTIGINTEIWDGGDTRGHQGECLHKYHRLPRALSSSVSQLWWYLPWSPGGESES